MAERRIRMGRRLGVALVTVAVVVLLAGCFPAVPPPKGSRAALTSLILTLKELPGVAAASGEVRQADEKDDPDHWLADIRVRASTADLGVARQVRAAASRGVTGTTLQVALEVPKADGLAGVTVDPMAESLVETADRLRRQAFVESVSMTSFGSWVTMESGVSITDAVTRIRPVIGIGSVTLSRSDTSVEVTAAAPAPALLGVIGALDTDRDVSSISYQAGTTYAGAAGGPAERAGLTVETRGAAVRDVPALANTLARTSDEVADARLAPRTAFSVFGDDGVDSSGWVGLPLGSARPRDDSPPVKTPAPTPPGLATPGPVTWVPANVDAQAAALHEFVERSIAATGIRAVVETGVEQCNPVGKSDLSGTRATVSTVVPIFTVYDDGQKPYDAVTAFWADAGLRHTDRALGLDFWADARAGALAASATIEGTVAGLDLAAKSACVA